MKPGTDDYFFLPFALDFLAVFLATFLTVFLAVPQPQHPQFMGFSLIVSAYAAETTSLILLSRWLSLQRRFDHD